MKNCGVLYGGTDMKAWGRGLVPPLVQENV